MYLGWTVTRILMWLALYSLSPGEPHECCATSFLTPACLWTFIFHLLLLFVVILHMTATNKLRENDRGSYLNDKCKAVSISKFPVNSRASKNLKWRYSVPKIYKAEETGASFRPRFLTNTPWRFIQWHFWTRIRDLPYPAPTIDKRWWGDFFFPMGQEFAANSRVPSVMCFFNLYLLHGPLKPVPCQVLWLEIHR